MASLINKKSDTILRITAALCVLAVIFALFSQHYLGMRPCAWCVLQRFILLLVAFLCLIASINMPKVIKRSFACIAAVTSISGIIAAWYQYSVAAEMFSCAQTFADKFISSSGLDTSMPWLFGIYATCMDAKVDLFGIEYAIWGLMLFIVCTLLIASVIVSWRNHSA